MRRVEAERAKNRKPIDVRHAKINQPGKKKKDKIKEWVKTRKERSRRRRS